MSLHTLTTPFGQRTLTLGMIEAQAKTQEALREATRSGSNAPVVVNKWAIFRHLTEAREGLGISDRSLGVLNALLSFHPETALTLPCPVPGADEPAAGDAPDDEGMGSSCDLVVFPSNRQLSLRAHGMAEKTLRNHLASLVAAGLIIRRDSPNGKRYARKDPLGQERFTDAFGFDLTPLVARASEFEALAEQVRRERRELLLLRERVSLYRRDIAKMIALGIEEGLEVPLEGARIAFLGLLTPLRRLGTISETASVADKLSGLRQGVAKLLETLQVRQENTGNAGVFSRHISNSKNLTPSESEPATQEETVHEALEPPTIDVVQLPLGLVLEACKDIEDYGPGGEVRNWPDFFEAARLVRPMIGISPDAWQEAREALGEMDAHVAVAAILQKSVHSSEAETVSGPAHGTVKVVVNGSPAIRSPGGYLRALTQKAQAGKFALGPVLMALIGQRTNARRMKGSIAFATVQVGK
ncbi:MAG: plasmid replication protein RepC [Beijerinckiaceae bacterium]